MDQTLCDALETGNRLKTLRTLPAGKVMHFAFAPEDSILMLHRSTELNRSRLVQALERARRPVGQLCDTVWAGEVWWAGDHPVFRVDLKRSVGQPMNVKKFRTALMAIARELKGTGALRDPEIVRQTDKVMSAEQLRATGGAESWKAKLGSGSTYHKILNELEGLDKAKSNEARRESLDTLLRRIDRWFTNNEEDIGEGGDKVVRAAALSHLREQVVDELARTLEEGRLAPTEDERRIALASLNESARLAFRNPDLHTYTRAATRIERWASLGLRPESDTTLQIGMGLAHELETKATIATPSSVKAASRFVRAVRLDLLSAPTSDARIDLIQTQMAALEALDHALQTVIRTPGAGEEWEETQSAAARELIKLERDLSAIRQELGLQQAIEQDNGRVRFTGGDRPTGQSGSYFVGDGQQPRAIVFKPFSQEVPQNDIGWKPGVGARGEVLGYRVGERLGERLGVNLHLPPTEVGVLTAPRLGDYEVVDDRDELIARSPQQLGVMQRFVPTTNGDMARHRVYRDPVFGVILPAQPLSDDELLELLDQQLRDRQELEWNQLDREARKQVLNRIAVAENVGWNFPPQVNLDELGRGLDQIAILDLFTLQTDRNAGNVLVDVYQDNEGNAHTRVVPIDQALCMPNLRAATSEFGNGARTDRKNGFAAWIDTAGHDRSLDPGLVQGIVDLDIDAMIEDMQLESEQLSESTGGRIEGLNVDQIEIQRLSMRTVQYALSQRPDLSRRQLANVIEDFDQIPWQGVPNPNGKSPFGEALRRLERLAEDRVLMLLGLERNQRGQQRALVNRRLDEERQLSAKDYEDEWTLRLQPSIDQWLMALPV